MAVSERDAGEKGFRLVRARGLINIDETRKSGGQSMHRDLPAYEPKCDRVTCK